MLRALVAALLLTAFAALADGDMVWRPDQALPADDEIATLSEQVFEIYVKQHPTWHMPPQYPVVNYATGRALCHILGNDGYDRCAEALTAGRYGIVDIGYGTGDRWPHLDVDILLADGRNYGDANGRGMIAHEIAHYIAYYNDGPVINCEKWLEREHEAYAVQARWLETHGGGQYVMRAMQMGAAQKCTQAPAYPVYP